MFIDQQTGLYGIIGHPLGHTLSPVMHNAAFSASGINAVYLAFESKRIEECLAGMRGLGVRGLSVTIPHKSTVIPLLEKVDDMAERIGAVNTIVNRDGKLVGYNTDAAGALKALEEKTKLEGKKGLVVGAGGAARAIGFILKERGVQLTIANRSSDRGERLSGALNCKFLPLKDLESFVADILIQTTPVGMYPAVEECPLSPRILNREMIVMDVVYNPLETKLLKKAKSIGCTTIDGLSMFIHQGAEQFRLWTDRVPPIDVMEQSVKAALNKTS